MRENGWMNAETNGYMEYRKMDKQYMMKPHIYLLNIIITIQNSWIPEPKQATNRVG